MTSPAGGHHDDGHDPELMSARALVLHDLEITGISEAASVSALEESLSNRRWWVAQWPEGRQYVAGLVAQDVQDSLLSTRGRWPVCGVCGEAETHALYVHPEIGGPDPHWVCEESGTVVATLGHLPQPTGPAGS